MKKSLKIISLILPSLLALSAFFVAPTFADDVCDSSAAPEVKNAAGCDGTSDGISNVIINVINGIVGILALVAVVAIIVGGVQYMTSTGDSGKVKKAKDTILYALIGLIICALAFAIVNFVIVNVINK